ncbi:55kDa protein [Human adenovirus 54]|uniref:E1B 55 kDa protein n=1 Tax=Human adenovirus 54 TaxID=651580 RepID=B9A5L6_9ADEN|nr:E1B 55 kDa protein [Human adenovirus 54]BAH18880.1 55kDa protein [Human adenovirus 54]BAH84788.1 E1B 55 kDa protein [Human adenovirus 54]BAX64508.1 55kDa protein [Human adenovirus 54]BAX64660.1 55kDa protein [Human adenovirus 54]BAX65382.1 55kDa protein [Human adenovirus 54]
MEPGHPTKQGLHSGLCSHAPVEGLDEAAGTENLELLAFTASSVGSSSSTQTNIHVGGRNEGGHGREPEERPGPSVGRGAGLNEVSSLYPELSKVLTSMARGVKRERSDGGNTGLMTELTASLMNRKRPERITWHELQQECRDEIGLMQDKYGLEQIKTHWLNPDEDWEEAIKKYAKIALRPDCKYRVTKTVNIKHACYISGNGAEVDIDTLDKSAFRCCMMGMRVGVMNMNSMIFINIKFNGEKFNGVLFMANSHMTLHGCSFFGFNNMCAEVWGAAKIRGCKFYGCWMGVVGRPKSEMSVKQCVFEKCYLGVCTEGNARVRHCSSLETGCFCLVKGTASIKHNVVKGCTDERMYNMLTCDSGVCHILKNIHVTSHPRKKWPVFENNLLIKCHMHLGARRGTFQPYQCNFSQTKLLLENDAFSRVNLNGIFDMDVSVYKILRYDETKSRVRACECGGRHTRMQPVALDVTEELRPDHLVMACTGTEFSSSGEDTD